MTLSLDISNLERCYATRAATPESVVRGIYTRIRTKGVQPDWIALVDEEAAVANARSAPHGPLYGIPFAVKDNIDVAGLPTTCACPAFAYTPERSAAVVDLLREAGAILIGKTNLDQFATGLNGTRSPYGIPASAFDPRYIAGGSSSGSAVAVASGLVSFALGTDTAGSGRVPAAFNNLVGLKPSKGLISMRGVVPACRTQDTVSIFALTAGDACKVAEAAISFDAADPYARRGAPAFSVQAVPKPVRIGIPEQPLSFFGDGEYGLLYQAAADRLHALGAEIVPVDFAPFEKAAAMLYGGPWVAERLIAIGDLVARDPEAIHPVVRDIILGARDVTAVQAFHAFYELADHVRDAETEWAKMDVLLLPTAPTTFTIEAMLAEPVKLNSQLGAFTNFVNLMDLAAIAVPAGFRPDGLPFGVTLIGKALTDGMLAVLADTLHRSLPDTILGATAAKLASTPSLPPASPHHRVQVAVVGAHLSGQPLNTQLIVRGASLVATTRTAPGYRLVALASAIPPKPGLVFDGVSRGEIEVEVWELDLAAFGSFVALVQPPLCIGSVTLCTGEIVKGFLCEAHAAAQSEDITASGGWRGWLGSRGA